MLTGHKAKAIEDARGASSYTRIRGTLGWLVGWLGAEQEESSLE